MKATGKAFSFWYCVVASALAASLTLADDKTADESRIKRMQEKWAASAEEIVFYGRVVDQHNQPVAGCTISANAPIPIGYMQDKARRCQVQSDAEGRFEITRKSFGVSALKGSFLFIESIEKEGYEYVRGTDPHLGFSYRQGYTDKHEPDTQNPIIFHMRKKESVATFLIQERYLELRVDIGDSGKSRGRDFIQRGPIRDVVHPRGDDAARVCDLRVSATFNTNDATWTVVLSPGNTNGGIIVSEELLYEAPETGYQPEYTFTAEDRKPVKAKYVYLKSRDPAIYTRLEIEHINANRDFFRLIGKSVTNPYGERNLEEATDLPYEVVKQLTDEARAAFRQNKRPEKPDLSKLVKEAKEKTEKDKPKL